MATSPLISNCTCGWFIQAAAIAEGIRVEHATGCPITEGATPIHETNDDDDDHTFARSLFAKPEGSN